MAPAASASPTMSFITAISSSVAARSDPSGPMTEVRTGECPTKAATLGTGFFALRKARYSGKVSNPHWTPDRSASRFIPSTTDRLAATRSRHRGGQGAMPKPQLPITMVVTPSDGDGEAVGSQVSCAS